MTFLQKLSAKGYLKIWTVESGLDGADWIGRGRERVLSSALTGTAAPWPEMAAHVENDLRITDNRTESTRRTRGARRTHQDLLLRRRANENGVRHSGADGVDGEMQLGL